MGIFERSESYLSRTNVRNRVRNIANQCVWEGGLAVYEARTLWDNIEPGLQNDYTTVDNCHESIEERTQQQSNGVDTDKLDIRIYPNPSTGIVNLDLASSLTKGEVTIQDVLGRSVYTKLIDTQQQSIQLDLTNLAGVYIISIVDGDIILDTRKLVIQ